MPGKVKIGVSFRQDNSVLSITTESVGR